MKKWVDSIALGIFFMLLFILRKYEAVKVETTETYILMPLLWYDFVIFPLFYWFFGWISCRLFLLKGKLTLCKPIKKTCLFLITLLEIIYTWGSMLFMVGNSLLSSEWVAILHYALRWIFDRGIFAFIVFGFFNAIIFTEYENYKIE